MDKEKGQKGGSSAQEKVDEGAKPSTASHPDDREPLGRILTVHEDIIDSPALDAFFVHSRTRTQRGAGQKWHRPAVCMEFEVLDAATMRMTDRPQLPRDG